MEDLHTAAAADAFGPPEAFALRRMEKPRPRPGEVLIAVRVAGVSFVDALIAAGGYQLRPALPYTPGTEFAGVVAAVGEGVDPLRIGDRVCAVAMGGGYAEFALAKAEKVAVMPDAMSFEQGAVFLSSYTTAYHALVQRAGLSRSETVLVLGAGGAVGVAAIEVAKVLGARVIASAAGRSRQELASRAGADAILNSAEEGWRACIDQFTGGRGVDVVVDPVGGAAMERAFRTLRWKGRHLVIGFASGEIGRLPANLALVKGASLIGVDIRGFAEEEPALARCNQERLFALFEAGALRPHIAVRFSLSEFKEAIARTRDRELAGRVVIYMDHNR